MSKIIRTAVAVACVALAQELARQIGLMPQTASIQNLLIAPAYASSEIESRVKAIIALHLGLNERDIKLESGFVADLQADSLDTVEIIMALEEEFGLEIPDDAAVRMTTVEQAVTYVREHLPAAP
jgi:acyl carrier protein